MEGGSDTINIDTTILLQQGTYRIFARMWDSIDGIVDTEEITFHVHGGPEATTSISISDPAPGSSYPIGHNITVKVSVKMPENRSVEKVELYAGERIIEELFSSPYQNRGWYPTASGNYLIKAKMTMNDGEEIWAEDVPISVGTEVVNPIGIELLSPTADEVFLPSDTLSLKAKPIGGAPGTVSHVKFSVGGEWSEEVTTPGADGIYETDWTGQVPGRHEVLAVASVVNDGDLESDPVYINVSGGIELITPTHGQQFNLSQPIPMKAKLAEGVPVDEVAKIRFIYQGTLIEEIPGNGTDTYEHSWLPGEAGRYEGVRVIAILTDGNMHRSPGIAIRVNEG
ncbi:MAG TPA: Ig-like domain-containing protein [Pseudosphingobacterium sp.]|nr:Ig-like domain-containing protein [Pseudosphingobacterium sp.]